MSETVSAIEKVWSWSPEQLRERWVPVEDTDDWCNVHPGDALIVGESVWQLRGEDKGKDTLCICHDGVSLPAGTVVFESLTLAGCPVYRQPVGRKGGR